MAIRYITYDIEEGNSYDDLYNLLEEIKAEEITKSTYKTESKIKFDELCRRLKEATASGDKISVIYRTDDSISHKEIR